jgi:hypothetical protein
MNTKLLFASLATLASTAGLAGFSSAAHAGNLEVGGQLQIAPAGSVEFSVDGDDDSESVDTDTAFGLVGIVDYVINPNVSVGFAPRLVLGVAGDGADESATQLDLAARITGRLPVAPKVDLFAYLAPGYSFTFPPEEADELGTPSGPSVGVGAGAAFKVTPVISLVGELGYSWSFHGGTAEALGQEVDYDYKANFLHLGFGVKAAI